VLETALLPNFFNCLEDLTFVPTWVSIATLRVFEGGFEMFSLPARLAKNRPALKKTCQLLSILLLLVPVTVRGQGSGVASTGTGGSHIIKGYVFFPSGRKADGTIEVKLQCLNAGEITVMADTNGSFTFLSLAPGNYTIIINAGVNYEIAREGVVIESELNPSRSAGTINGTSRRYSLMVTLQPKFDPNARAKASVVNAALVEVPDEPRRLYEKGLELADAGDTLNAIDNLKAAVSLYPGFPLALNVLGVQYLKVGQVSKAIAALTSAATLSPDAFAPKLNLGIALLETNRFADAEKQLREAIRLNQSIPTAHMYLGVALARLHNDPEAESELRNAISSGSNQVGLAHKYLGGLYWKQHNYQQAADELDTYLRLTPNAQDADRLRATIKDLRGRS
jgi:tetratricopeptide (TPR) repeat protein